MQIVMDVLDAVIIWGLIGIVLASPVWASYGLYRLGKFAAGRFQPAMRLSAIPQFR